VVSTRSIRALAIAMLSVAFVRIVDSWLGKGYSLGVAVLAGTLVVTAAMLICTALIALEAGWSEAFGHLRYVVRFIARGEENDC